MFFVVVVVVVVVLLNFAITTPTVAILRGGGTPELALPHPGPWYYAWTIQNFINALIFRVMPRACYVKSTMKSRIRSSTDSDCTRTHLRGPTI